MIGSSELIMIFGVFIVWIPIIVLAYLGIRYLINRKKTRSYEGKSTLDLAKERYAKGEITKEEFEEIKRNLL
jgi:putative membrane protein